MSPAPPGRYRTGDPVLDDAVDALIAGAEVAPDEDLVFEMVVTALRLGREPVHRGELKLVNAALKELRYSFAVFEPYRHIRKVSIFGSARIAAGSPEYEAARHLGRAMAAAGWMVITGAGPGIMQAGIEGAGPEQSFGVGIQLPFESTPSTIEGDPKLINFKYFFTRKVTFMKESHGFVLLPGGFGTLDEAFELLTLLQTGRSPLAPIVLLDPPGSTYWDTWYHFVETELVGRGLVSPHDLALVRVAADVEEATEELVGFYRRYHSARTVGRRLVLRLTEPLPEDELHRLAGRYADIVTDGRIEAVGPTQPELDDGDHPHLARIALRFDRRSYARLRQLVDDLNAAPPLRPDSTAGAIR